MTKINELRTLLCEVEEVRKDQMELKTGTIITYSQDDCLYTTVKILLVNKYSDYVRVSPGYNYKTPKKLLKKYIKEIVGNPLEERHLRMYCEKNDIIFIIYQNGDCRTINEGFEERLFRLDLTKSLQDQSEETIEKIIEFLKDNK